MDSETNEESSLTEKTKSLNQSGAFLQIHVKNELEKRGWITSMEIPVRVCPFITEPRKHQLVMARSINNPSYHISPDTYTRAIIESMNRNEIKETSVDVIGTKRIDNATFNLCIESKKLDPRFMDWVFFKQEEHDNNMRFFSRTKNIQGLVDLFTLENTLNMGFNTYLRIMKYASWGSMKHDVADFAMSLKNKQIETDYYKSDKTKVDESTRQIMEGIYGYMIERILDHVRRSEPVLYGNLNDIVIPIVVTNANLYLCKFNPDYIDPTTGRLTKEPEYEQVESIIYECPIPAIIQFPDLLSASLSEEQRKYVSKWHVLILSPNGFTNFLNDFSRFTG